MRPWLIGTSGFSYPEWRGVFYPPGLPSREWLAFYAREFPALELNVTFYRTPRASAVEAWAAAVPPSFRFVLKLARQVTHVRRLRGCGSALAAFWSRASLLGEALGAVLVQLPPSLRFDAGLLDAFLGELPRGFPRLAWEPRHRSFGSDEALAWLRERGQSLVVADSGGRYPEIRAFTASPAYLRFHGPQGLYTSAYGEGQLAAYAAWVRDKVPADAPVYAFFNNDAGGHAIEDARQLRALAGAAPVVPPSHPPLRRGVE